MKFLSPVSHRARFVLVGLLSLTAACRFTFDRKVEPGEISGTVVFQGSPGAPSLPAIGARVAIENSSIAVLTDSHGLFSIRQLPPQKYTLDFTASSAGSKVVDFGLRMPNVVLKDASGNNGQDLGKLAIAELGGLAGTVTNMASPVDGATIALTSIATAKTAHGNYEFQNLLPGDYTMSAFEATPAGGLLSNLTTVTVKPRQIVQIPNIELAQAMVITSGSATGTALTQGGTGVAVSVSLQTLPNVQQTTDSSGNYNLMNVPAGVYTVVAAASGFRTATAVGVVIAGPPTDVPLMMLSPVSVPEPPDAGPSLPTTTTVTSADGGVQQQMVPMTADGGSPVAPSSSGGGATQSSSTNYQASTSTGAPANKVLGSTHFRFTPSGGVPSLANGGSK